MESRHGKRAEDSSLISMVVPKEIRNEIDGNRTPQHPTTSSVVRKYIFWGLTKDRKEKQKCQKNPKTN